MNKSTPLFLVITFLVVFSVVKTNAQVIDSMMKIYADEYPEQKVHVHFDKDIYRAGETIWFKAYLFAGYLPAVNSRNFYAELVDNDGNVLQQKVYPIVESSCAGNFDIPASTAGNTFKFRAYTTWMLNFDTAYIFKKDIVISGKEGDFKKPVVNQKTENVFSLRFFPEGGSLVNNIESAVAFKANDAFGLPINVSGTIVNSKGATVANFKSMHDGMGVFNIEPAVNESYVAKWKSVDGVEHTTNVPSAKNSGIVLRMENVTGKKVFIIKRPPEDQTYKSVRVIAQIGQQMVYKARVPLDNFINSGFVPVANMPSGIMTVTVFSEAMEPLAERILMVNNNNYIVGASLSTPGVNLGKRAKNTLEISIPDTNLTNLSISVSDAGLSNTLNRENIISRLLLTGDLKGYVHNPSYYFSNTADSITKHVDLVMLTNGWRRYKWQDLVQGRRPALKYPVDPYLSLKAKVFGITSASPLRPDEQLTAILQTKDSAKHVFIIPRTGRDTFSVAGLMFYDTAKVYYQFTKNPSLNGLASVKFDNGLYKGNKKISKDSLWNVSGSIDTNIIGRNKTITNEVIKYGSNWNTTGNVLESVVVKTRVKSRAQQLDDMYSSGLFKGSDALSFDILNDPTALASQNIFNYLQSRVAGLMINNPMSPSPSVTWRQGQTALFLNEMPVGAEQMSTVNVADIAYIKVFRPPFFGAVGGGSGGAIAVYTRKGNDLVQTSTSKGLDMNTIVGYSSLKEFYVPDYSTPEQVDNVTADYRTTLYWSPFIFMDGSRQKVKIDFYNNDITKAFKVIVEGFNEVGKLVRIEKVIE